VLINIIIITIYCILTITVENYISGVGKIQDFYGNTIDGPACSNLCIHKIKRVIVLLLVVIVVVAVVVVVVVILVVVVVVVVVVVFVILLKRKFVLYT
jgi:hypothetical protein